jgi:TPR repeat protein
MLCSKPNIRLIIGALALSLGLLVFAGCDSQSGPASKQVQGEDGSDEAQSQYEKAEALYDGTECLKDYRKAFFWYAQAAKGGSAIGAANMGLMLLKGQGVSKNAALGASWLQWAAHHGSRLAQYNLGVCHEKGYGLPKDYGKARYWYLQAAEAGSNRAKFNLGGIYAKGMGVTRSPSLAFAWRMQAAVDGYAKAQNSVGAYFYYGQGVGQNYAQAVHWFEKAASQGSASAARNLAFCYAHGKGIAKDKKKAIELFRGAAAKGDAQAIAQLKRSGAAVLEIQRLKIKPLPVRAGQGFQLTTRFQLSTGMTNGRQAPVICRYSIRSGKKTLWGPKESKANAISGKVMKQAQRLVSANTPGVYAVDIELIHKKASIKRSIEFEVR